MIGVHVECDRCGHYFVYCDVPVTKAKSQARKAGWYFGKTVTLCRACEPFKRADLTINQTNTAGKPRKQVQP